MLTWAVIIRSSLCLCSAFTNYRSYKIYAESFLSPGHLRSIQLEAQTLIGGLFGRAGAEGREG